jgi:hypothetical protein
MPTLEITTMMGCPMQCTFCPQDKLVANYPADAVRALSLDKFKEILAKVPRHVRIDFSGMAEPWANRHATGMLEHTLLDGRNVAVYTTLQGMHDPEAVVSSLRFHSSQVEVVVVHLPDARGNMRGFRYSEQYRRSLELFRGLRDVRFMTMGESAGPVDMRWNPITRAGNLDLQRIEDQPIVPDPVYRTPVSCSFTPFYDQNVLLPNGDVVLCCMDYSVKHKLGNLLEQDYYDIFRSDALARLHAENMRGDGDSLCHTCSRAKSYVVGPHKKQYWEAA